MSQGPTLYMCYCMTPLFLEQTKYLYQLCYVVLYAQCSTVSSVAHTSQKTQSTTTMENRAQSCWLPWQRDVIDPLTHSITLTCTCKESFHIIMKCVTYNHPKLPGPVIINQAYPQRYVNIPPKCQLEGHNKKSSQFFFNITFSEHGTNNTLCLK